LKYLQIACLFANTSLYSTRTRSIGCWKYFADKEEGKCKREAGEQFYADISLFISFIVSC